MLVELNKPLRLVNLELGELSFGQVLVRVLVSGICGSQLHEISGNKGNRKFLPHLMGHEGCGIVEEIGPGVKTVKPGDKVVMHWRVGIGIESDFSANHKSTVSATALQSFVVAASLKRPAERSASRISSFFSLSM